MKCMRELVAKLGRNSAEKAPGGLASFLMLHWPTSTSFIAILRAASHTWSRKRNASMAGRAKFPRNRRIWGGRVAGGWVVTVLSREHCVLICNRGWESLGPPCQINHIKWVRMVYILRLVPISPLGIHRRGMFTLHNDCSLLWNRYTTV